MWKIIQITKKDKTHIYNYGFYLLISPLFFSLPASASTNIINVTKKDNIENLSLKKRSLKNIISHYQRAGYKLYYSDALVTNDMISYSNSALDDPIYRLENLLLTFGLSLEYDTESDAPDINYYIVEGVPYNQPKALSRGASELRIEEVVVTGSTYHLRSEAIGSKATRTALEISDSLTPANDPVRILNTLPGIASVGLSAKMNIRGGNDDELLIIFDDVELIDPFHLKDFQSLISGIDAKIIKSMDIYTGGYPVRYGGKMSGVMKIEPQDDVGDFSNTFSVNPFATSIQTQGESQSKDAYWLASARRGNIDDALNEINSNIGSPQFHDFFGKIGLRLNEESEISVGYLLIQDDISLNQLDGDEGEFSTSLYISQYGWLKANIHHDSGSISQWMITSADIKNVRSGYINEPNNPDESVGKIDDHRDFDLHRLEYLFARSSKERSDFEFGFRIERGDASYRYKANVLRGELATLIGSEREHNISISESPAGLSGFVFASYQYSPWENIDIAGGLRYDAQRYYSKGQYQFSPRLAARFILTDKLVFKASAGRFFQSSRITELDVEAGQTDFYSAQKSDHSIAGIEYNATNQLQFSLEAYTKHIQSPKPRNQNLFNPYVLLPELSADRIRITPYKAESEGLESRVNHVYSEHIRTWLSFSISEVEDSVGGEEIRRRWNQTRAIRTGISYINGPLSFNSQIQWHKGWRYTQLPWAVDNLNDPIDYQRNNASQPEFFSWDARVSYMWSTPSYSLEAYIEVFNLTDRENIGAIEIEISPQADGDGFLLTPNPETLLPIIPSIGFTLKF